MDKKTFISVGSKSFGSEGQGSAIISTGTPDRENDRLIPSGVKLHNYRKNPIVLYAHDHSALPVGKDAIVAVGENDIRARWNWLENDEFAGRVRNAWEQGALSATSVGFIPMEYEKNELGGYNFTEWELMEFSVVPVPANPEALALRMIKGLNDDLKRRQRGAVDDDELISFDGMSFDDALRDRDDDEVLFRLRDNDNEMITFKGLRFKRADLRGAVKTYVTKRLESTRDLSRDDGAVISVDGVRLSKEALAAMVKTASQETVTRLTGRIF